MEFKKKNLTFVSSWTQERRKEMQPKVFKNTMAENFPNLAINTKIQSDHQTQYTQRNLCQDTS